MDWSTVVTAAVAIYGAVVSTYTLIQNRKERQRRVRVKLSTGFLSKPELSPDMLLIQATNPGDRTVILNIIGLFLPNDRVVVFPNPESNVRFPHTLGEGDSCMVWTPLKELAQQLRQEDYSGTVKLVGFCRDQLGTEYKSKVFAFDVDEWND